MNRFAITAAAAAILSLGTVHAEEVTVNPPAGTPRAFNSAITGGYGASRVEAKLNVNIKENTRKIHFIRDNSDPYVVTKGYLIKKADAFTLRGVLKTIISGTLVDSPVMVDSVVYNDGTGVLMVSAEEYRFKDAGNGMSMDELVSSLDRKDLANSYGTVDMAYFPKYNPAKTLLKMMEESGIGFTQGNTTQKAKIISTVNLSTDPDRLSYAVTDDKMNVIVMTAAGFDINEALRFLKSVDTPAEEIRLTYKLIEVYAENDQKLGLDFQAWKNNDGIDLFTAGGRYGTNWNNGLTPNNGYTYSEFFNFNPKWNTKYLDFLTVCGKAKVVSTGSMTVANEGTASLTLVDGLFSVVNYDIKDSEDTPKTSVTTTETVGNKTITTTKEYNASTNLLAYTLEALLPKTDANKTYASNVQQIPTEVLDSHNVREGKTQEMEPVNGNLFQLTVGGDVHGKASNLDVVLGSTSIIGWDGQGRARLTKSFYKTKVQINSEQKEFVIGGLSKSSVVRSVAGFPFLKDIPVLGWIFSTETDTVKKSQFVLVAKAELVKSSDRISKDVADQIKEVNGKIEKAVKSPAGTLGFQQLLFDTKNIKDLK